DTTSGQLRVVAVDEEADRTNATGRLDLSERQTARVFLIVGRELGAIEPVGGVTRRETELTVIVREVVVTAAQETLVAGDDAIVGQEVELANADEFLRARDVSVVVVDDTAGVDRADAVIERAAGQLRTVGAIEQVRLRDQRIREEAVGLHFAGARTS